MLNSGSYTTALEDRLTMPNWAVLDRERFGMLADFWLPVSRRASRGRASNEASVATCSASAFKASHVAESRVTVICTSLTDEARGVGQFRTVGVHEWGKQRKEELTYASPTASCVGASIPTLTFDPV